MRLKTQVPDESELENNVASVSEPEAMGPTPSWADGIKEKKTNKEVPSVSTVSKIILRDTLRKQGYFHLKVERNISESVR